MGDKSDLLAELVAADATIEEQAKEIERLKIMVAFLFVLFWYQKREGHKQRQCHTCRTATTAIPDGAWIASRSYMTSGN